MMSYPCDYNAGTTPCEDAKRCQAICNTGVQCLRCKVFDGLCFQHWNIVNNKPVTDISILENDLIRINIETKIISDDEMIIEGKKEFGNVWVRLEMKKLQRITDGKSGDDVFLGDINGRKCVFKKINVGKNKIKQQEINIHLCMFDTWLISGKKSRLIFPKIYLHGACEKNENYRYILMERVGGTSLSKHITAQCDDDLKGKRLKEIQSKNKRLVYALANVILNLRYRYKIQHCDLHTDNIYVDFEESDIQSEPIVKIIDFGQASYDSCSKQRELSSVLASVAKKCNLPYIDSMLKVAKGEVLSFLSNKRIITQLEIDPDTMFFLYIVNILKLKNLYSDNLDMAKIKQKIKSQKNPDKTIEILREFIKDNSVQWHL